MSVYYTYERLYKAARDGVISEIEDALFFLGEEKVRDTRLVEQETALYIAASKHHTDVVELLIERLYQAKDRAHKAEHAFWRAYKYKV